MKKHFFSLRERGLFLLLLGLFLSFSSYAQDITVKGVVKDSKFGDPIIGASVLVKGTTNGTISDMDGNFTLAAPKDGTLTISYIGYKSQEIPVNGQQNLNIILDEDVEALDEVVVVGYATGSKRTISGAVERIKKEDMNQGVVNTPLESLKGKVAGVVISKTGGDPASKPSIRVRGTTSLSGGNDPLVIIDGVFGDLSMLDAIAPADIETFTILKDASETAQYGSRGAAGVIVVTTVKGKNGMKTLSYNGNFGISNVYKNLKMLSADEFRSTAKALGMTPLDMGGNTNFFDEIEQLGYTQNHNISFGAGNDDSNYRASVGVIDQQGIIKNSGMKNYTAKLDASQNMFNNKLKIEFGMFGSLKQVDYTNDYEKTFVFYPFLYTCTNSSFSIFSHIRHASFGMNQRQTSGKLMECFQPHPESGRNIAPMILSQRINKFVSDASTRINHQNVFTRELIMGRHHGSHPVITESFGGFIQIYYRKRRMAV